MRRLFWLGVVIGSAGAVAVVGCSDSSSVPEGGGGAGGAAGALGAAGSGGGLAGMGAAGMGAAGMGAAGMGAAGMGVAGMGAAGNGAAGAPALTAPTPVGLVALNSDFMSTSLSILNSAGGLAHGDCVHSSTTGVPGSTPTISGDAVLPSQPQLGGSVVIVDRGNDALTFVDPTSCAITRQVSLPGGAATDPNDVVILSATRAYLTRYQQVLSATTPAEMGNDVAVIDPTTGAFLSRIGLDAYASTVQGVTILARPDRALIADGRVVVSLSEADASYTHYGEGKIAVIDPATDTVVASVALTGLLDCEGMDYVDATKTLLVACGGQYGSAQQIAQSGVAVVDLGVSPPVLTRVISGTVFGDQPVNFGWVLARPASAGTTAFASTSDPNAAMPDTLYLVDYVAGTATAIATSDPFSLGTPAATAALLFVPEATATTPKIQLFDITATPQAATGFASDPTNGLPPREIAWY